MEPDTPVGIAPKFAMLRAFERGSDAARAPVPNTVSVSARALESYSSRAYAIDFAFARDLTMLGDSDNANLET